MRMRQIFVVLALFCMLFVLIEAKGKWKKKKYHMMKKTLKGKSGHHGMGNNISKQKMKKMMKKMEGNDDGSMYHPKMMKKVSPKKHIAWLKLKSEKDCGLKCKRGEVCIVGPVDAKLMCVSKKDLKKSMKLFHKYQKKEKKAWKAFKVKHYNKAEEDDSAYFSKFDSKIAGEDMPEGKQPTAVVKPHHVASKEHKHQVCTTAQFSAMRKRMMGWFHLLQGHDHMAQSVHGERGNLKQFHKHNSVRKEQRDLDGTKCECAKSAMWQFSMMDKKQDDHLSHDEIAQMYKNDAEPCLKPFFTSCDLNADEKLSSAEWCCCFSNIVAPCYSRLQEIQSDAIAVQYIPRCDREGYYRTEQCSGEKDGTYKCWCVDYNGNEYKDSARKGRRAHCGKLEPHGYEKNPEYH